MRALSCFRCLLPFLFLLVPLPARAAVTITFWSHDFGREFPHAFFTLRGRPDAGGGYVDANYGFTARSISPGILWHSVPGRLDSEKRDYLERSEAQFSLVLSDAQYAAVVAMFAGWDPRTGDGHYNLASRNCVHFVAEAARRIGLAGTVQPELMKKPSAYLLAVEAANVGRVTPINLPGVRYLSRLTPLAIATRP